ncbi:MAG: hypothetical protein ABI977_29565 [Acidobacteriota bacterium]
MLEDPIIEELHKIREEIAAESNYDMHAIVVALRRRQQAENRSVVSLPPKRLVATEGSQERTGDLSQGGKAAKLSPENAAEPDEQKKYNEHHN